MAWPNHLLGDALLVALGLWWILSPDTVTRLYRSLGNPMLGGASIVRFCGFIILMIVTVSLFVEF